MKLDILVELRDQPGQLSAVLATVGRYGGNIQSVQHARGKAHGEWVPVRLVLEVADDASQKLLDALREEFRVVSVEGQVAKIPYAFLLLGHVFQSKVNEFTDAVFKAGAEVRTLRAEITKESEPSAVLIEILAGDHETLEAARARVAQLAKSRGLVYVDALRAEGP